ncbi:MAG TPA: DinB family protein [Cyclobacteriaceae bacterium]|nr:DinB family protein [Cyclobacteriaceae bacterium]
MEIKERWIEPIDKITSDFRQSFGALSMVELNWKPHPNTWSIGQNLDHLIAINGTYYPVINAVKAGITRLPFLAKFDFMVSFLGRTILKSVQPDRRKKMKTFPIWEPTKSDVQGDIWERFENNQSELKKLIESCPGLLDRGVIISSPANKNIVYRLDTAFDIIVAHERRHFEQCKEVRALLKD